MAVTGPSLTCRIGTVRLPRRAAVGAGDLARAVEYELGRLLHLAPPPTRGADAVLCWPHRVLPVPASSSPAELARLIALQIHQQLRSGGTW